MTVTIGFFDRVSFNQYSLPNHFLENVVEDLCSFRSRKFEVLSESSSGPSYVRKIEKSDPFEIVVIKIILWVGSYFLIPAAAFAVRAYIRQNYHFTIFADNSDKKIKENLLADVVPLMPKGKVTQFTQAFYPNGDLEQVVLLNLKSLTDDSFFSKCLVNNMTNTIIIEYYFKKQPSVAEKYLSLVLKNSDLLTPFNKSEFKSMIASQYVELGQPQDAERVAYQIEDTDSKNFQLYQCLQFYCKNDQGREAVALFQTLDPQNNSFYQEAEQLVYPYLGLKSQLAFVLKREKSEIESYLQKLAEKHICEDLLQECSQVDRSLDPPLLLKTLLSIYQKMTDKTQEVHMVEEALLNLSSQQVTH